MPVVSFNFTKIAAERETAPRAGKITIKNNIAIKGVESADLTLGKAKQEGLKFKFEFSSAYEPATGKIGLDGEVFYIDEAAKVKEILKAWKKSKRLPDNVMNVVLNNILGRCAVQAVVLSKEINLPPPVPVPKVNVTPAK